jgi:hypothetical protein
MARTRGVNEARPAPPLAAREPVGDLPTATPGPAGLDTVMAVIATGADLEDAVRAAVAAGGDRVGLAHWALTDPCLPPGDRDDRAKAVIACAQGAGRRDLKAIQALGGGVARALVEAKVAPKWAVKAGLATGDGRLALTEWVLTEVCPAAYPYPGGYHGLLMRVDALRACMHGAKGKTKREMLARFDWEWEGLVEAVRDRARWPRADDAAEAVYFSAPAFLNHMADANDHTDPDDGYGHYMADVSARFEDQDWDLEDAWGQEVWDELGSQVFEGAQLNLGRRGRRDASRVTVFARVSAGRSPSQRGQSRTSRRPQVIVSGSRSSRGQF